VKQTFQIEDERDVGAKITLGNLNNLNLPVPSKVLSFPLGYI
jgi:hypothetical protein